MGSDYSTSLLVNLSDKPLYYSIIKNKMIQEVKATLNEATVGAILGKVGAIMPEMTAKKG